MSGRILLLLLVSGCGAGCANQARRAPAVQASAPAPRAADHPDILKAAGDATWGVITTPARIVSGPGKNKTEAPQPGEPPTAVITPRTLEDADEPAPAPQ